MVKDVLPYSFAGNFLVLSLKACNLGTQFSKYPMIVVSLLLLSSRSDHACPKRWQRQLLLNDGWCYCKKASNQIDIF